MPRSKRAARRSRARRSHLRKTFDREVSKESRRFRGAPTRRLHGELRDRFLRSHLGTGAGRVLEVGPGPGRFTATIRSLPHRSLVGLDLSRSVLESGRRQAHRRSPPRPTHWVQGAGELLPFRDASFDSVVIYGNVLCFAADEAPALVRELARVLRRGGRVVADLATPAGALVEFLELSQRRRKLLPILRDPTYYLVHRILDTGLQPRWPSRWARWEFRFYPPAEARRLFEDAGFAVRDLSSVAPLSFLRDDLVRKAHRDRRGWEGLLRLEEKVGRRPEAREIGHGLLLAARRLSSRATGPSSRRARRGSPPRAGARPRPRAPTSR